MHVLIFFISTGLCLALILTLQAMITLDDKRNRPWVPRRTTFQPELFDQDAEEVKE
jgi:hypothetical protein